MTETQVQLNDLRDNLRHVLWIGGGTDAGKTTVAEALVEQYGFRYYNFDRNERSHISRMEEAGYYAGRKSPYAMTPDELWVDPEPAEMATGLLRGWGERAHYAIDDILALPDDRPIMAEGPGFFPSIIHPLLSSTRQAIWFVPEPTFKRTIAIQRGKPSVRLETGDPVRATENIIARDLLAANHIRKTATELDLVWMEVDGSLSIEERVAKAADHFLPYLRENGYVK